MAAAGINGINQFFRLFLLTQGMHIIFYTMDSLKLLNVTIILLHILEVSGLTFGLKTDCPG